MPGVCGVSSTQTARIFCCHQDWKQRLALASKVLKHPVVSSVMVVRVMMVGENRVGVRPLWVTPCHVIRLLLGAEDIRSVSGYFNPADSGFTKTDNKYCNNKQFHLCIMQQKCS